MSKLDVNDVLGSLLSKVTLSKSEKDERVKPQPNEAFRELVEAHDSPLTIFQCIADVGFYQWNPNGREYKELADVTEVDFLGFIDEQAKPCVALPLYTLRKKCPIRFAGIPPQTHWNRFPFNPTYMTSLHVAVKYRNVKLDTMNFVFGGSTLNMLASQEVSSAGKYFATLVPGSRTLIVAKHSEYEQDYAQPGFQFERFVTGGRFEDKHDDGLVEHMHIMKVGNHRVLFTADCDAIDKDGNPLEIKCSNPQYWGTKVMFQMLSNGSTSLYSGRKRSGKLVDVSVESLDSMIDKVEESYNLKSLENNILSGMKILQDAIDSGKFDDGTTRMISFSGNELKLVSCGNVAAMLPRDEVIRSFLGEL